jgi:hypothetical protein
MMILRCTSSHTRSSLCAPIKTTQMLLPSYKKNTPSFAFVFLKGVSWKKQAAAAALLMRTLSRVFISDYVDVFPKRRKERVLGFWLF